MTATEELRRLLDERGVKHKDEDTALDTHGTLYRVTTTADWVYEEPPSCDLLVRSRYDIGAEDAIEVEATLGTGILTADDVRDLIERHSDASGGNGRDFHNGAYVAIADELNATLGRGTCKLSRGTSGLMHVTTGHCSECGAEVVKGTKDGYRSRYCQWCGAKVVER